MNDTSTIYFDLVRSLSGREKNQVLGKLTTKSNIAQQLSEKYLPDDELVRSKHALEVSFIISDNIAHQQSTSTTRSPPSKLALQIKSLTSATGLYREHLWLSNWSVSMNEEYEL
jgi:hypothetical protein